MHRMIGAPVQETRTIPDISLSAERDNDVMGPRVTRVAPSSLGALALDGDVHVTIGGDSLAPGLSRGDGRDGGPKSGHRVHSARYWPEQLPLEGVDGAVRQVARIAVIEGPKCCESTDWFAGKDVPTFPDSRKDCTMDLGRDP